MEGSEGGREAERRFPSPGCSRISEERGGCAGTGGTGKGQRGGARPGPGGDGSGARASPALPASSGGKGNLFVQRQPPSAAPEPAMP